MQPHFAELFGVAAAASSLYAAQSKTMIPLRVAIAANLFAMIYRLLHGTYPTFPLGALRRFGRDSNKIIGRNIGIKETTVKAHVKGILRKIRVRNRAQAAIWAMNKSLYEDRVRTGGLPYPTAGRFFFLIIGAISINRELSL
jgi:hypothetical protein